MTWFMGNFPMPDSAPIPRCLQHLSDGSLVLLGNGASPSNLYVSSDHFGLVHVDSVDLDVTIGRITVDAQDNIYVLGKKSVPARTDTGTAISGSPTITDPSSVLSDVGKTVTCLGSTISGGSATVIAVNPGVSFTISSNAAASATDTYTFTVTYSLGVQAFVKGPGYTWSKVPDPTQFITLTWAPASMTMVWCNPLSASNPGMLVFAAQAVGNGQIWVMDAGSAQASLDQITGDTGGILSTGNTFTPASGAGNELEISTDGYGEPSGIIVKPISSATMSVVAWSVDIDGVFRYGGNNGPATSHAAPRVGVVRVAPQTWVVITSDASGHLSARPIGMSADGITVAWLAAATIHGTITNWSNPGLNARWEAIFDPASNAVNCYSYHTADSIHISFSVFGGWSGSIVVDDAGITDASPPTYFEMVREPRVTDRVDYAINNVTGGATAGNYVSLRATSPPPTVTAPVDEGDANHSAAVDYLFNARNPLDTVDQFSLRRQAPSSIAEYWTGSAWQKLPAHLADPGGTLTPGFVPATVYDLSAATSNQDGDWSEFTDSVNFRSLTLPVVTATVASSGVSRPTVTATYAQAEKIPQHRGRVRLFTTLQYGVAGFDPLTSPGVADSGWVTSPTFLKWLSDVDLDDGNYRAVWISDTIGALQATGVSSVFAIAPTRPHQPTLNSLYDANAGVTVISVGTDDAPTGVIVERSDDGGTTWVLVRYSDELLAAGTYGSSTYGGTTYGGGVFAGSGGTYGSGLYGTGSYGVEGAATLFVAPDFEYPPNSLPLYRARTLLSGIPSVNAVPIAVATPARRAWLKDPLDPSNNFQILHDQSAAFTETSDADVTVLAPYGRSDYVVISGQVRDDKFTRQFVFQDEASYQQFITLRKKNKKMLYQSDGTQQWYVRIDSTVERSTLMAADRRTAPTSTVKVPFVTVARP